MFERDRDNIIRNQLDEISRLVNENLKNLNPELLALSYKKPVEETEDHECEIIPFVYPINRRL